MAINYDKQMSHNYSTRTSNLLQYFSPLHNYNKFYKTQLKLLLRKNYEASSRLFEKIFRKFVKFERKF